MTKAEIEEDFRKLREAVFATNGDISDDEAKVLLHIEMNLAKELLILLVSIDEKLTRV